MAKTHTLYTLEDILRLATMENRELLVGDLAHLIYMHAKLKTQMSKKRYKELIIAPVKPTKDGVLENLPTGTKIWADWHDEISKKYEKETQGIDHQLRSTEGEEALTHNDVMKEYVDYILKLPDLVTGSMKSVIEIKPEQPLTDAIDWNVPQAFPKDYVIPNGVEVQIAAGSGIPIGCKGVVNGFEKRGPYTFIKFMLNGRLYEFYPEIFAPINPTDHPLHPEFGIGKLMQNGLNLKTLTYCHD